MSAVGEEAKVSRRPYNIASDPVPNSIICRLSFESARERNEASETLDLFEIHKLMNPFVVHPDRPYSGDAGLTGRRAWYEVLRTTGSQGCVVNSGGVYNRDTS